MGRILLWVTALAVSVCIIAALIAWLAPLLAALAVLYIAGKIVSNQALEEAHKNKFMTTVDS